MTQRWDETWYRLLEWTNGQGPSERLAAQILLAEGYSSVDPSHPLGGKDGCKDALCKRGNQIWILAVYFPRSQQSFSEIESKFRSDLKGVKLNSAHGIVFITNQELRLSERKKLKSLGNVDLLHLERITTILDSPQMASTRKQFLGIDFADSELPQAVDQKLSDIQQHLAALQTGGDSFCYWMLYHFDISKGVAQNFALIRSGDHPLYDVRIRIRDMDNAQDVFSRNWGELNSPADFLLLKWPLAPSVYYRVFFFARNGSWNQDLILNRSEISNCWLAATRVLGKSGTPRHMHLDCEFVSQFGEPEWRS